MKRRNFFYRLDVRLSVAIIGVFLLWFISILVTLQIIKREREERDLLLLESKITTIIEKERPIILNDILLSHDQGLDLAVRRLHEELGLQFIELKLPDSRKTFSAGEKSAGSRRSKRFEFNINYDSKDYGRLTVEAPAPDSQEMVRALPWIALATALLLLGVFQIIRKFFSTQVIEPINGLVASFENEPAAIVGSLRGRSYEHDQLLTRFLNMKKAIAHLQTQALAREKRVALGELAQQVAHDIKSPLNALHMVIDAATELKVKHRELLDVAVKRIRDIADHLLSEARNSEPGVEEVQHEGPLEAEGRLRDQVSLVNSIVESIVAQKKLEFNFRPQVIISSSFPEGPFQAYSKVPALELDRALSNLINNAVESIENEGAVSVSVVGQKDFVIIEVADNGCGIPEDVVPKLGTKGSSYRKEKGNGLGIAHAMNLATQSGGFLKIESKISVGTKVQMWLPRYHHPDGR